MTWIRPRLVGGVYYQAFAAGECPYESYPGACFVVQWNDVVHFAIPEGSGTDDLTFEIILFDNGEALIQIEDAGDERGTGSTTGIENADASVGLTYVCDTADSLSDGAAILFKRSPDVRYVKASATGGNNGTSWTDAFTDLQVALALTSIGEQVWVAEGVYLPGDANTDTFQLGDNMEIYGGFEGNSGSEGQIDLQDPTKFFSVLSGDLNDDDDTKTENGIVTNATGIISPNSDHVVSSSGTNETAVLDGLVVTAGKNFLTRGGGGMSNISGSPTLVSVTFSGNYAFNGGGMYNDTNSDPLLINVTFSGNRGTLGGGMATRNQSDAILVDCTFKNNTVVTRKKGLVFEAKTVTEVNGNGAGMFSYRSSPVLTGVTFSDNNSHAFGGGMVIDFGSPILTDVTFIGNTAGFHGGGMRCTSGSKSTLTNVIFSGNSATSDIAGRGGGMFISGSDSILTNVTFSLNSSGDVGGGLRIVGSESTVLQNCVHWGNSPATISLESSDLTILDSIVEGDCNLLVTLCTDVIDADPLFVDADGPDDIAGTPDDDLRLAAGSPAIDTGDNDADLDGAGAGTTTISNIATDLAGDPRIVDGDFDGSSTVDMGALEHVPQPRPPIIYVNDDATGANTGLDWTDAFTDLQAALIFSIPGTQIWVAEGVYLPGDAESDTFRLKNELEIYGGFEGLPGTEGDFNVRQHETFVTVLSGDIDGNDVTDAAGVVVDAGDVVGMNSFHVVNGSEVDETAVLDGFTITGGQADGDPFIDLFGGGMYIFQGNPTLSNLTFAGNLASAGGGMMITDDSDPILRNVAFSRNAASIGLGGGVVIGARSAPSFLNCSFTQNRSDDDGGGMANFNDGFPTLTGVTFTGNTATDGAGMFINSDMGAILTDVTFTGNIASHEGGGIYSLESPTTITGGTFLDNAAEDGGGMWTQSGISSLALIRFLGNSAENIGGGMYNFENDLTLTNAVFSGNTAGEGGGILSSGRTQTLTNVTFFRNTASVGGGMYNLNITTSIQTIQNCIFWENVATGGNGDQILTPGTVVVTTINDSLVQDGCPTDVSFACANVIDASPLFVDGDGPDDIVGTLDDDLRLSMGSPAINMGNNAADLDAGGPGTTTISDILFDLDGLFRIADGTVDMGPYEFGSVAPSPTRTTTSTVTETPTITNTGEVIATHTLTLTETEALTAMPTATETPTITNTGEVTATHTPTPTETEALTAMPTATGTPTITNTGEITATRTPTEEVSLNECDLSGDQTVDAEDLIMLLESDSPNDVDLLFFARCWFEDLSP